MKTEFPYLRIIFGVIVLGMALALWLLPQQQQSVQPSPPRQQLTHVEVAGVEAITTTRTIRFSGVTRAAHRAVIAFSIPGRLVSRPVEAGSRVEEGGELAGVDLHEYQNRVNMARATLAFGSRRAPC